MGYKTTIVMSKNQNTKVSGKKLNENKKETRITQFQCSVGVYGYKY